MSPDIAVDGTILHLSREEAILASAALVHERINRVIEAENNGADEAAVKKIYQETKVLKTLAETINHAIS